MRVVFFGDGENIFSNRHFHALLETDARIVTVVDAPKVNWRSTNTTDPGEFESCVEWAEKNGVPVVRSKNPNTPETVRILAALDPDLFVAVGYTRLIKDSLLSIPRLGAVNFHASLLPAYRGKHPLYWALQNRELLVGLTVHFMDSGLDTGDILYQVEVAVREDDTVASLYARIMDRSTELVSRLIGDAENDNLRGTPQEDFPWEPSYYSSLPGEESI